MKIHFQFSADDVRRINLERESYVLSCCGDPSTWRIFWYLLLPVTVVALAVVGGSFPFAIFAFALFWGVSHIVNRWHRARFVKNYYCAGNFSSTLLPFELELLSDRLILSNADLIHHHFWHSFQFLRETADYFHLHFSSVSSMVIPKSAFASPSELEAFREAIRSHEPGGLI